jgi:hypothetical protein
VAVACVGLMTNMALCVWRKFCEVSVNANVVPQNFHDEFGRLAGFD